MSIRIGLFLLLAFASTANAGLMELLSSGAYLATDKPCEGYTEENAAPVLKAMESCSQAHGLVYKANILNKIETSVETNAQDRYFAALAEQHAKELGCAGDFAYGIYKGDPASLDNVKTKFKLLRGFQEELTQATDMLNSDPSIMGKTCDNTVAELTSPYDVHEREFKDKRYMLCKMIIETRDKVAKVRSSIPLYGQPLVAKLANSYAAWDSSSEEAKKLDATLEADLKKAYGDTKSSLDIQKKRLEENAASTIKNGVNKDRESERDLRITLLSDPAVIDKVLAQAGHDKTLTDVACRANAEYGKGAANLDVAIQLGSLGLTLASGGSALAARLAALGFNGAKFAMGLNTAARILQFTAVAADGAALASTIRSQCFDHSGMNTSAQCVSAPNAKDLALDNCILNAALQGAGTAAGITAIGIQNKTDKLLAQLTAKRNAEVGAAEFQSVLNAAAAGSKTEQLEAVGTLAAVRLDAASNLAGAQASYKQINKQLQNLVINSKDPEVQKAAMEALIKFRAENSAAGEYDDVLYRITRSDVPEEIRNLAGVTKEVEGHFPKLSAADKKTVTDSLLAGRGVPEKFRQLYIADLKIDNLIDVERNLSFLGYKEIKGIGRTIFKRPNGGGEIILPNYRPGVDWPGLSVAEQAKVRQALKNTGDYEYKDAAQMSDVLNSPRTQGWALEQSAAAIKSGDYARLQDATRALTEMRVNPSTDAAAIKQANEALVYGIAHDARPWAQEDLMNAYIRFQHQTAVNGGLRGHMHQNLLNFYRNPQLSEDARKAALEELKREDVPVPGQ